MLKFRLKLPIALKILILLAGVTLTLQVWAAGQDSPEEPAKPPEALPGTPALTQPPAPKAPAIKFEAPDPAKLALQAKELLAAGRTQAALDAMQTAIDLGGKSAANYLWLAQTYEADGQNDAALAEWNAVLALEPNNAGALLSRGLMFAQAGNTKSAIADLEAARQLRKLSDAALLTLAQAYAALPNIPKAEAVYDELLRSRPNDSNLKAARDSLRAQTLDPKQASALNLASTFSYREPASGLTLNLPEGWKIKPPSRNDPYLAFIQGNLGEVLMLQKPVSLPPEVTGLTFAQDWLSLQENSAAGFKLEAKSWDGQNPQTADNYWAYGQSGLNPQAEIYLVKAGQGYRLSLILAPDRAQDLPGLVKILTQGLNSQEVK